MLTSVNVLKTVKSLRSQTDDMLSLLLGFADRAVKDYLKQNVEAADYTEYYSGDGQPVLILNQRPVNSITNLYLDQSGYWGQAPNAFPPGSELTQGASFALVLDKGGTASNRGLVQRIGGSGSGAGFWGWAPEIMYSGKLSASRLPFWPFGQGNIKCVYNAGYAQIPPSIVEACIMTVAWMARNIPVGGILNNESLGAYSYSLMFPPIGSVPELGSVTRSLSHYREMW